ncbi:MAG: hypothetical protein KGJ35_01085 [Patescibacteria group bacterium]|nr:hypothetical protein [Patescibacteria group bacterium]
MKSKTNPFSLLGLDPQYLRGVPDELVAQIVKSAFRNLISYYHDDKRNFPLDDYQKKQKTEFDRRRTEIMEAHRLLSTSGGRLKALAEYRESRLAGLKDELQNQHNESENLVRLLLKKQLEMMLDQVGALPKGDYNNPIGKIWGGGIITSFGSEFRDFGTAYEFELGTEGLVAGIWVCKLIPLERVMNPKKQSWHLPKTMNRSACCAVRDKAMFVPKGCKVIGSLEEGPFDTHICRNPKALLDGVPGKSSSALPFYRLHAKNMLGLMGSLDTNLNGGSHLVLLDSEGTFYFAGSIRKTLPPQKLTGGRSRTI